MRTFVLYRPVRRERALEALLAAGIPDAEMVLGPDGQSVVVPPSCALSPAEVACYEGHRNILERAQGELSLVLEDDFLPEPGWREQLDAIVALADRPWDYINLGRCLTLGAKPAWHGVEDAFSLTTHAYLLSPEGGSRFLEQIPPPSRFPFDWVPMLMRMMGLLNVYTASPRFFRQARATCPGLIHVEAEPSEFWPNSLALPAEQWYKR